MTSHMLSAQMQPAVSQSAADSTALAYSYPPAVCMLPKNNARASSLGTCGLLKPRNGFLPSALQQTNIDACSSLKENQNRNEDDLEAMKQCAEASRNNNPSLQVECHLFSPPSNWDRQPVTPSPHQSHSIPHDNSSGWTVPNVRLQKMSSSNGIGSDGRRVGYDGTSQTPSVQLLKPTASSLGHRVHKASASPRAKQVPRLHQGALQNRPYSMDSLNHGPRPQDMTPSIPGSTHNTAMMGIHMAKMSFYTPASSSLDPFGKLNRSSHSNIATSEGDEDMASNGLNSSDLLENFDFDLDMEHTDENRMGDRQWLTHASGGSDMTKPPGNFNLPKASLSRCASWSPGQGYNAYENGRPCHERLRSMTMDPVASQLLRECAVHEEEEEEECDSLSMSSHVIGRAQRASSAYTRDLCRSPKPPSDKNGAFSFSTSMPDLQSPIPPVSNMDRGGRMAKRTISEESPINYPMSPVPLYQDAIDSVPDLNKADDMTFLARPVARKFGRPMIAGSPSKRRASFSSIPRQT